MASSLHHLRCLFSACPPPDPLVTEGAVTGSEMHLPLAALGPGRNATSLGNDGSSGGNWACLLTSSLLTGLGTQRPQRKGQLQRQLQKKNACRDQVFRSTEVQPGPQRWRSGCRPRGGNRGSVPPEGHGQSPALCDSVFSPVKWSGSCFIMRG